MAPLNYRVTKFKPLIQAHAEEYSHIKGSRLYSTRN